MPQIAVPALIGTDLRTVLVRRNIGRSGGLLLRIKSDFLVARQYAIFLVYILHHRYSLTEILEIFGQTIELIGVALSARNRIGIE